MEIKIKKTPHDLEIRKHVLELVESAKKEVIIVTGEWSAFDYFELRHAVREALKRGVKFKVYGTGIPPHRVNIGINYGCEIYQGAKSAYPHFVIADRKNGVVSEKHPPEKRGERWGIYYKNSPKSLKDKIALFGRLLKEAKKLKSVEYADPLLEIIENPLDFGVETDSSKIDKVIYA